MKQQITSIAALLLVLDAGTAAATQTGQHAQTPPRQGDGAITGEQGKPPSPPSRCLPMAAGDLPPGQPDYADTRRELAQRARQGATASERAHAAEMLARIADEEAKASKQAAAARMRQRPPPNICP